MTPIRDARTINITPSLLIFKGALRASGVVQVITGQVYAGWRKGEDDGSSFRDVGQYLVRTFQQGTVCTPDLACQRTQEHRRTAPMPISQNCSLLCQSVVHEGRMSACMSGRRAAQKGSCPTDLPLGGW